MNPKEIITTVANKLIEYALDKGGQNLQPLIRGFLKAEGPKLEELIRVGDTEAPPSDPDVDVDDDIDDALERGDF